MDFNRVLEYKKENVPLYVFDAEELKERSACILEKLPSNAELCYAMKANPFLVTSLEHNVSHFEVCSPGELEICIQNKIPGEKIIFSGVNKQKEEIRRAVEYGVSVVTLESERQFRSVLECAREMGKRITVLPRLSNGAQFGMEKEDVEQMIAEREKYLELDFQGIQYFTGTQKKKADKIVAEMQLLTDFAQELAEKYGFQAEVLEFGPGLWVPYFEGEEFENEFQGLSVIAEFINNIGKGYRWILEMGRYVAASCGYYVTSVADTKKADGRNYAILDGGINHFNYYGQNMAMRIPQITHMSHPESLAEEEEWCLCGSLCTFADVMVRKVKFSGLRVGDTLIFHRIGAYSVTEGIYLFLSRTMPEVYLYESERGMQLLRNRVETWRWNTLPEGALENG